MGDSTWTLRDLRDANVKRQAEWCPDQQPDLSFRGNELAGETGEACNEIKKLERERQGWRGSRTTVDKLAAELADVVICADLCAMQAGIDLHAAVAEKFNATSRAVGLSTMLGPAAVHVDPEAAARRLAQWLVNNATVYVNTKPRAPKITADDYMDHARAALAAADMAGVKHA